MKANDMNDGDLLTLKIALFAVTSHCIEEDIDYQDILNLTVRAPESDSGESPIYVCLQLKGRQDLNLNIQYQYKEESIDINYVLENEPDNVRRLSTSLEFMQDIEAITRAHFNSTLH